MRKKFFRSHVLQVHKHSETPSHTHTHTHTHTNTQADRKTASGGIEKHSGPCRNIQGSPLDKNPLPELFADRRAPVNLLFQTAPVFIRPRLYSGLVRYQSQDTRRRVKSHQRTCRRTPSPPPCSLHVSLFLSRPCALNFERTERGGGGGCGGGRLEVAMKDSDEGAAIKYTVDVIYLLMEGTHHTDTLSFKLTLSKLEPDADLERTRAARSRDHVLPT